MDGLGTSSKYRYPQSRKLDWKVVARVFDYLTPRTDYPEFPSFEVEEFTVTGESIFMATRAVENIMKGRSFLYTNSLPREEKNDGFRDSRYSCFIVSVECLTLLGVK